MTKVSINDATCEDKYIAMSEWWKRHCKSFSEWFLSLSAEKQKELLIKACPDIPLTSVHTRMKEAAGDSSIEIQTTDIILPELALEPLLKCSGRIFIIFMTRRCVSETRCQLDDSVFLTDLFEKGQLPSFSQGAFASLDTPFIDPCDPDESIQCLSATATEDIRSQLAEHIKTGRLIYAEVWLALKIRRTAIIQLLENLVVAHQSEVAVKPSPTYDALLISELEQQAFGNKVDVQTSENDNKVEATQSPSVIEELD